MSDKSKDQPAPPPAELETWCKTYAPALPSRVEAVIAEWGISVADQALARDLLLEHVRKSVATAP